MLLVKTVIQGAAYKIEPLPYQKEIEKLGYALEDIRITAPIGEMAKSPLGTLFVVTKFTTPDPDHLHIEEEDLIPVEYSGSVFPLSAHDKDTVQKIGDALSKYMIDTNPGEYDLEFVESLSKQMEAFGYEYDWDEISKPKPIDLSGAGGSSLKRSIAAKYPAPKVEDCGFYVDPDIWFLLVRNVLRGENTLLTGPSGTGKTELIEHVSKVMGKEMSTQDMGTIFDAQSSLLGVHRIGKDGNSEFEFAPFVEHVQKGGIVLLDEMNRATLAANNILFPCLDRRRYLPVDVACGECGRTVPVHEDTVFIATANIGAEYSGTQAIDRALLDRFFPIELDYLKEDQEIEVIVKRTGVEEKVASSIVKVANEVRKQAKEQELSNAVSIRHNLQVASLVSDGFEVDKALIQTIMPLFTDGIGVSERSKVMSIISAF
jgi:nitric oxide reductase NorQ protein